MERSTWNGRHGTVKIERPNEDANSCEGRGAALPGGRQDWCPLSITEERRPQKQRRKGTIALTWPSRRGKRGDITSKAKTSLRIGRGVSGTNDRGCQGEWGRGGELASLTWTWTCLVCLLNKATDNLLGQRLEAQLGLHRVRPCQLGVVSRSVRIDGSRGYLAQSRPARGATLFDEKGAERGCVESGSIVVVGLEGK